MARGNITKRGASSWRLKYEAGEPDPLTGKRQTRPPEPWAMHIVSCTAG